MNTPLFGVIKHQFGVIKHQIGVLLHQISKNNRYGEPPKWRGLPYLSLDKLIDPVYNYRNIIQSIQYFIGISTN
ncbi:hypothetical protein JCM17380_36500 [Desulfosporosinus burensis]